MNEINLGTASCKKDRILHGNIPTAYHCNCATLEECSVTGCTVADTCSCEFFLSRYTQFSRRVAGCQYNCFSCIRSLVGSYLVSTFCKLDIRNIRHYSCDTELVQMLAHLCAKFESRHSGKSRVIVNFICIEDLSACSESLDQKRGKICSCSIYSRCESCGSCSYYYHVVYLIHMVSLQY